MGTDGSMDSVVDSVVDEVLRRVHRMRVELERYGDGIGGH